MRRVDESGEEEYDCRGGVKEEKEVFLLWADAVKRIDVLCHLCAGVTQVCFWSAPMWCWCHINYMSLRQCVSGLLRDGRLCASEWEVRFLSFSVSVEEKLQCDSQTRVAHDVMCVCVWVRGFVCMCAVILCKCVSLQRMRVWVCYQKHTHARQVFTSCGDMSLP